LGNGGAYGDTGGRQVGIKKGYGNWVDA
jgi:hypothetical protein